MQLPLSPSGSAEDETKYLLSTHTPTEFDDVDSEDEKATKESENDDSEKSGDESSRVDPRIADAKIFAEESRLNQACAAAAQAGVTSGNFALAKAKQGAEILGKKVAAAKKDAEENPKDFGVKVAVAGLTFVALPIVGSLVLGAVGFTSGGIAAGSAAAGWHSAMGGAVQAGSLFARMQSAGAIGFGAGAAVTQVTGGIVALGGAATSARIALQKRLGGATP